MNTCSTSFNSKTLSESQRDILDMIATDRHLDEILCAICQMLDAQSPKFSVQFCLLMPKANVCLTVRRPVCRLNTARRFMEWPLARRKEPAVPLRSGVSW